MKLQKQLIALSISMILVHQPLLATEDEANHFCDSSESVNAWGIWCLEPVLEATAAGPGAPIPIAALLPVDVSEIEQNESLEEPETHRFYQATYQTNSNYSATYERYLNSRGEYAYRLIDSRSDTSKSPSGIGRSTIGLFDETSNDQVGGYADDFQNTEVSESEIVDGDTTTITRVYSEVDVAKQGYNDTEQGYFYGEKSTTSFSTTSLPNGLENENNSITYEYIEGEEPGAIIWSPTLDKKRGQQAAALSSKASGKSMAKPVDRENK